MSSSSDSGGWIWLVILGGFAWWAFSSKDKSEAVVPSIQPVAVEPATQNLAEAATLPEVPAPTPAPTHRYDFVDDGVYGYTAGISEDERKAGKAAGNVLLYRYLGNVDGKDRLQAVDPAGRYIGLLECARPCKAIKAWYGGRVEMFAYDESSIAGSVFWDVSHHFLKAWSPPPSPPTVSPPSGSPSMPYYRDIAACEETSDTMGCDANTITEANAM